MLEADIFLDQIRAFTEPLFKVAGRFDHVHSGATISEWRNEVNARKDTADAGKIIAERWCGWFAVRPTPGNYAAKQAG